MPTSCSTQRSSTSSCSNCCCCTPRRTARRRRRQRRPPPSCDCACSTLPVGVVILRTAKPAVLFGRPMAPVALDEPPVELWQRPLLPRVPPSRPEAGAQPPLDQRVGVDILHIEVVDASLG